MNWSQAVDGFGRHLGIADTRHGLPDGLDEIPLEGRCDEAYEIDEVAPVGVLRIPQVGNRLVELKIDLSYFQICARGHTLANPVTNSSRRNTADRVTEWSAQRYPAGRLCDTVWEGASAHANEPSH